MSNIKVIDAADATPPKRKSPAQVIIESLDEDKFQTMRTMAERYQVNVETIRRLCKALNDDGTKKVKAPSKAVQQGGLTIYLFTTEDVEELDTYMSNKGYKVEDL